MVRPARMADAERIAALVNYYAERGRMLHRNLESVCEDLRDFVVADADNGWLAGCAALTVSGRDLGEIRSLAVDPDRQARGVGSRLVAEALQQARALGLKRIFVLTYEPEFFARFGFHVVDREALPTKVWRDCIHCSHADECSEIAMTLDLETTHG